MQPPPRKGNYCKFLKNLHTEQLAKLQLKNQHECELLDDIRQFTTKRSQIEKSYSEALLKISTAFLNKKIPNIPDIKIEGSEEKWNMWSVWRTVLEENEKLASARLAAIEVYQQQIVEDSKILREIKLQVSKKCINQLSNIHKELQICVSEVDKTKKQYFDEEHSAHDVRDKARDIEEKLKKKKGSFFQSITSLQKNSARVTSRKEQLEEKSTGARNDYILSLASANAHQNRYFTIDLQMAMSTMEHYVHDKVSEYLALMGRTELLTCFATQNSFGKIRDQAEQLTRDYNLQCCYLFYPVLKQHIQYDYEKCDDDIVTKITVEHESAAACLAREAKSLAGRIVRHNNLIRDYGRKLQICMTMRDNGQKVDPNDQNGPDLETKIEEFREQIRKAETEKCKSEACFDCLRAGGINVDEWLQEAETLEIQEITRSTSSLSMRTDISGQGENQSSDSFYDSDNAEPDVQSNANIPIAQDDDEISQTESVQDTDVDVMLEQERKKIEQLTVGWEDPTQVDWSTVDAETTNDTNQTGPIFKCTALYSYTAQNPDELTIVENEQLEVVGEGDGDGWLRARNYRGEEGYVPHNYLDVERDTPVDQTNNTSSQLTTQISFSSVDYTIDNDEQDGYQDSVQSPDQVSVISAPVKPKSNQLYCIALYDYDATAEDELTFEEGQIIKIITMSAHGVDDGWWEGELDGKTGNFPSLVVEECDENGEPLTEEEPEDESPPPSAYPVFTPPATLPPIEITGDSVFKEFSSENLELDLNINHQQKPQISQPKVDVKIKEEKIIDSKSTKDAANSDFNLGVAQIIVTAATPMSEEKHFPPCDGDKSSKIKKRDKHEERFDEEDEEDVEEDEQEEEEEEEEDEFVPDIIIKKESPIDDIKMCVDEMDHHPLDSPSDSDFESIKGQPSFNRVVIEPIPPVNIEQQQQQSNNDQNDNVENNEHFFEANFDEAFQDDPNAPKIVVGGRASIPDELAPYQLARLQNLKESNA